MTSILLSDLPLARRLERAEAHANRAFVEARARCSPDVGASWCEVGGTWAMFDGVDSPLTQTFGFGCFDEPSDAQLAALEAFFAERRADVAHEVSLMADARVLALLASHGYVAHEWSTVLCQRLGDVADETSGFRVREIDAAEIAQWADVSARGWGDTPELVDFVRGFGAVSAAAADTHAFLVEDADTREAIAAGSLHLHDGVALLAGASTVPAHRGRGAQRDLLRTRLAFAKARGADVAMIVAAPGSTSQRNAQRADFQVAYGRVKFLRRR